MSFLRKRNPNEVLVINHPEDEATFITLKAEFSKGDANSLVLSSPKDVEDRAGALSFVESLFALAVIDWSMEDEEGVRVKPTVEAYRELTVEAGSWVDEVLGEHISRTLGKYVEEAEGKLRSSPDSSSEDTP